MRLPLGMTIIQNQNQNQFTWNDYNAESESIYLTQDIYHYNAESESESIYLTHDIYIQLYNRYLLKNLKSRRLLLRLVYSCYH